MRPLKMTRSLAFTFIEVLVRGINWSFLFLAALFLPTESYGSLSIIVAIEAMLVVLLIAGYDKSALRFLADGEQNCNSNEVFSGWVVVSLAVCVLVIVSHYFVTWNERVYLKGGMFYLGLAAFFLVALNRFFAAIFRATDGIWEFVFLRLGCLFLKLVIFIYFLEHYAVAAESYVLATFVAFLASTFLVFKVSKSESFSKKNVKAASLYALPFLPHALSGILLANIDRVMIDSFLTLNDVAVYSFAYTLGSALSFFYAIVAVTYEKKLFSVASDFSAVHSLQKEYFIFLNVIGFLMLPVVYGIAFFIGNFREGYAGEEFIQIVLMVYVSYIVNVQYLKASYGLAVHKQSVSIAWVTMSSMFLNVALNLILLERIGVIGAAVATLLSYIFLSIVITGVAQQKTKIVIFDYDSKIFSSLIAVLIVLLWYNPLWGVLFAVLVALFQITRCAKAAKILFLD